MRIVDVDQNIIKVHYNKNVKFSIKDLIYIALKTAWCIGKTKRYDLIFEVDILNLKSSLLFVIFLNFYLKISVYKI